VNPLVTAVNSIHLVDEPPLGSGIDWVFELVHVSLGLLLLDGIPQAFVWFSASHVLRATIYVIWKVFRGFLFGFPAGHLSWGCLPVIWMVFGWLLYFVYLFIVVWISSRGFPCPAYISYLFRINLILLLSNSFCITTSGL
jgi:hypothetical protein